MFHITGKMNRGLMVVVSLCHLVGDRPLTAEEERLVFTLGWCVEMVSACPTIIDYMRSHNNHMSSPCYVDIT